MSRISSLTSRSGPAGAAGSAIVGPVGPVGESAWKAVGAVPPKDPKARARSREYLKQYVGHSVLIYRHGLGTTGGKGGGGVMPDPMETMLHAAWIASRSKA
jgi:hypothetical protein